MANYHSIMDINIPAPAIGAKVGQPWKRLMPLMAATLCVGALCTALPMWQTAPTNFLVRPSTKPMQKIHKPNAPPLLPAHKGRSAEPKNVRSATSLASHTSDSVILSSVPSAILPAHLQMPAPHLIAGVLLFLGLTLWAFWKAAAVFVRYTNERTRTPPMKSSAAALVPIDDVDFTPEDAICAAAEGLPLSSRSEDLRKGEDRLRDMLRHSDRRTLDASAASRRDMMKDTLLRLQAPTVSMYYFFLRRLLLEVRLILFQTSGLSDALTAKAVDELAQCGCAEGTPDAIRDICDCITQNGVELGALEQKVSAAMASGEANKVFALTDPEHKVVVCLADRIFGIHLE